MSFKRRNSTAYTILKFCSKNQHNQLQFKKTLHREHTTQNSQKNNKYTRFKNK